MKLSGITLLLTIAALSFQASCSNNAAIMGGNCEYAEFEGYAVIKSISAAPASEYNCPDNPKKVLFDFTPADIKAREKYRFSNFPDNSIRLEINDGANPSQSWITANKVEKGKKYKCIRRELTKGTCTPVIFKLLELDTFPSSGCK